MGGKRIGLDIRQIASRGRRDALGMNILSFHVMFVLTGCKVSGIAQGLAYLHDEGVIHSDIKSVRVAECIGCFSNSFNIVFLGKDNILVSNDGEALICDFGCSRMLAASRTLAQLTSDLKGTSSYLSYELVTERCMGHTKQSDVWAFGMTIFVSITR